MLQRSVDDSNVIVAFRSMLKQVSTIFRDERRMLLNSTLNANWPLSPSLQCTLETYWLRFMLPDAQQ